MLQYYVYYKADPARTDELRALVNALFAKVESATGIRGRLERRRDDPATFMEIYADVPEATRFEAALDAALAEVQFRELIAQRVTEVFQCA